MAAPIGILRPKVKSASGRPHTAPTPAPAAREPRIRWPGRCFVDSYHWQKGVGKDRQPYDDDRWGVVEPNTFGTHEFIELCRRVGAEPYICQNGLADTQEMADWVAYCNSTTGKFAEMRKVNGHPEPFDVKFWSVGNERSGRTYIHKVRDGAKAMRHGLGTKVWA